MGVFCSCIHSFILRIEFAKENTSNKWRQTAYFSILWWIFTQEEVDNHHKYIHKDHSSYVQHCTIFALHLECKIQPPDSGVNISCSSKIMLTHYHTIAPEKTWHN